MMVATAAVAAVGHDVRNHDDDDDGSNDDHYNDYGGYGGE